MKIFLYQLIFYFFVFGSTATFAKTNYTVVYNENTAPFVPLVRAIYKKMAMNPEFILLPSERAISGTNSGQYDADLCRGADSLNDYPDLIFTKEPLKKIELFAYVKKGSKIQINQISDLHLHKIGIGRGSKFPESFAKKHKILFQFANSTELLYSMLEHNRYDIVLITSTQLLAESKNKFSPHVVRIGPILDSAHSFHVLNKKHSDLAVKFDEALKALKLDGSFDKLSP